ncbi:2OG-Fe dioxygenase family protein [Curvibacter gracilis]|uniref:2OG-Fe dioxygenase family protein n=1 Tax=Curvibacter gracilis TaxID=230310 RepID=UPI000A00996E|nr:2OG-Fe dioxygenase family protein [Curvibacter gracilis]
MPIIKEISTEPVLGRSVWVGNCIQEVFEGACDSNAIAIAATSWADLDADNYLRDGGRYRRRRYAELAYDLHTSSLTDLKRNEFFQSNAYNHVNGGTRRFRLIDDAFLQSPLIQKILKHFSHRFATALGVASLELFLHQVRILGEPGINGLPTPEGIHKDGVDFSCQVLFGRHNLSGGKSIIYDNEKNPLMTATMLEPLDFYCFRDPDIYHAVTPVASEDGIKTGTRDILGIEFCVRRERAES